jgi:hypothetical protein
MYLITCSCGREYNADQLNRCPACSKLTQELVKEATKKEAGPAAPVVPPRIQPGMSDDVARKILAELQQQTPMIRMIRNIAISFSITAALFFAILFLATI